MKNKAFHCRPVTVYVDGVAVARYKSVRDFIAAECVGEFDSAVSRRLQRHVDGWLADGRVARYEGDTLEGRPLDTKKVTATRRMLTPKQEKERELEETEREIDELRDRYLRGEITVEERNERMCWLQNHAEVLRNRIKGRFVDD